MVVGPNSPKWLKTDPIQKPLKKDIAWANSLVIMAVDPGGVTGWSVMHLADDFYRCSTQEEVFDTKIIRWWHGQVDCREDEAAGCWQLKRIADRFPSAAIIFEGFNVRQLAVDLSPVSITARVDDFLWEHGRSMFKQSAAQAKTTATDDRLKLWGAYTSEGGLGHARDADRHAILFMRRCMKDKDLRKKAWGV